MQPQDLVDRRGQVLVLDAGVDLVGQPLRDSRLAGEPLEPPGELRCGRLVAGDQRRHQLVAELLRRHRRTVLMPRLQQHREHVLATLVALGPALFDQVEHQRVGAGLLRDEPPQGREPAAGVLLQRGQHRQRALAERQDVGERIAELVEVRALVESEHGAEDDLERQPLEAGMERDRLLERPGVELALGQLGHQAGHALHPLAVECREQQLALLEVGALVEQDHGVASDQRLEDARALAGVEHVRRRLEQLLDLLRVGEDHERRLEREANGDPRAVALAQPFHGRRGSLPGRDQLQCGREPRPRWQLILEDALAHFASGRG